MIHKINFFLTKVFNLLLKPFNNLNDFWPVLFLSIVLSFIILFILKYISFPKKIVESKDKIKASIFAIRIYKDFWKVILSSFFKSLFYTFKYFVFNLAPFLIIIPLLLPVFSQMEMRYGIRPYKVGEEIILKAKFSNSIKDANINLEKSENFKPKMNPVFIDAFLDEDKTRPLREINWKLEALKEGISRIDIVVNDKKYSKRLVTGDFKEPLSGRKYDRSSINHFFYPSETLLGANDMLRSVTIDYPGKLVNFLGLKMHWIIWNIIIVIVLIMGFRKRFGVEF
ncbi:MAG: hypothetical protein ABFR75_06135 [Acidobacteriota bacterium]